MFGVATQAERTAKMRARLLRATVRTLVQLGYKRTTTIEICRRAKVSRGAQLHHFPTKAELVAVAVEQVFSDRMSELQGVVERVARGELDLHGLIEGVWVDYKGPAFYAWLELVVAARTDPHLRQHVRKVDARFTQRAEMFATLALANRVRGPRDTAAATRLALALLEGLALHHIVVGDERLPLDVLALLARLSSR
jgi:AcrR family transcriptional regulator